MISGHYLGEIFRQIVHDMIDEGVLFLGQVCEGTRTRSTATELSMCRSEHVQD